MLVRVFFSFKKETNNPKRSTNVQIVSDIKDKILDDFENEDIFDYYFYQEGEKGYNKTDHFSASKNANYFIFFISDIYNNSVICKKEYHFFNKNHLYPKRHHCIYENRFSFEKLDLISNLEFLSNLSLQDAAELNDIKTIEEVCNEYNLYETNYWLDENLKSDKIKSELREKQGGEVSDYLFKFREMVSTAFINQTFIGGNFGLPEKERVKLLAFFNDSSINRLFFLSPLLFDIKPLMPNKTKRNGKDIPSWQKNINLKCIIKSKKIIYFLNSAYDESPSLKTLSRYFNPGDEITIVTKEKLSTKIKSVGQHTKKFNYVHFSNPNSLKSNFLKEASKIITL